MQKFYIDQEPVVHLSTKYDIDSPLKHAKFAECPLNDTGKFSIYGVREPVKWHNVFKGNFNGHHRAKSAYK